ncbi:ribonuclease R [Oscillatoria sp. CS-180]|uniref:ribonuclease catalytic domain-containing protein n=1 Tax=Oscillatoria sp. CS-180 TaxID=3021720 RepID=UPI00232CBAA4|nr:ribonuclease R family protein [Oscillatoria sp. CS-180]MDB9526921.1 ribonuclease R [Oscillatoria sp. CS-180]
MQKGTLVEFQVKGSPRLGILDRPEGKKNWIVLDDRGQSHTIHPRSLTFQFAQPVEEDYTAEDLTTLQAEAEKYIDPSSLQVAWELLQEAGESVEPSSLALLLFSDQSFAFCYAAHRLLADDTIFFKQKGDRYEPRPPAQVQERLHQIEKEAQRKAEWDGFLGRTQQRLAGESVEWQKSDRVRLETLEKFALLGDESNQKGQAQEVLSALGRQMTSESAFHLLVDLGLWKVHENLALRRSQIPVDFPEAVVTMAQYRLINVSPDADENRLDLTALKTYTIDDESTREIDDALSMETLPDGRQRLWVHIADPTRWVAPGDALDLEARRRCTTVYLPTGMVPMFPIELATGPMSLIQGEERCALSFGVVLTGAGAIEEYCIAASLVRPTYRLTYEDVDEMLDLGIQAEPELLAIAHWAKIREQWRAQQGAINIHMPESSIRVLQEDEQDSIDIRVLDDSPSRELVAEMMILAGEVAARYGQDNALAMPFRSQPQPELPPEEELMQLPSALVRYSAIRRCMPRSEMGITPARHATLGLEGYSQVTSPIRRYTDLLAHFQIKAHLRGDPLPFSSDEITELTQGASSGAYEAVLVERQTKRYWALEYLRRRGQETLWSVLLLRWLRENDRLGLVLFEELGLELPMRFERNVELGERLQIKITHANPRQDIIRMQEVTIEEETDSLAEVSS